MMAVFIKSSFAGDWHQQKNKHIKLSAEGIDHISEQLKIYWRPQQIVGRLALLDEKIKISAETLTFDNGRAFNWHEKLAEKLECIKFVLILLFMEIILVQFFSYIY